MSKTPSLYTGPERRRINRRELGEELRKMRTDARLSLAEASKILNIPKSTLQNWESGVSCPKKYSDILSMLFHYTVRRLMHWQELTTRVYGTSVSLNGNQTAAVSMKKQISTIDELYEKCGRSLSEQDKNRRDSLIQEIAAAAVT